MSISRTPDVGYQPLELRVARHPSESRSAFLTRVLRFASNTRRNRLLDGLSERTSRHRDSDLRVFFGYGSTWALRSRRACTVPQGGGASWFLYAQGPSIVAERLGGERIHRVEALEGMRLDPAWLAGGLAPRLQRRNDLLVDHRGTACLSLAGR